VIPGTSHTADPTSHQILSGIYLSVNKINHHIILPM